MALIHSSVDPFEATRAAKSAKLPRAAPWDLERIWQADPEQLRAECSIDRLPALWRLLVLGDGFTTRNLQLLTGERIVAQVLASEPMDPQDPLPPVDVAPLGEPLWSRQVRLVTNKTRQPMLYASSWWNAERMQASLSDLSQPIGQSLAGSRREVFRELLGVYLGHSQPLEAMFQRPGPFWGRHYWLWHQQQPLTLISEVFSPALGIPTD